MPKYVLGLLLVLILGGGLVIAMTSDRGDTGDSPGQPAPHALDQSN